MSAVTNEEKLRKLETFKRLINLVLVMICLGLEVGDFAYHWLAHFQYSVVEQLRDFLSGWVPGIMINGVMQELKRL